MKRFVNIALSGSVVAQILILVGMYVLAVLPLWTGKEVKLKTIPVDPRSMFRGNYARLNYGISQIDASHFPQDKDLRNGEVVYVVLMPDGEELFVFSKIMLNKPATGVFLRGRIQNRHYENKTSYYRVNYGIEAFFAPREQALKLEQQLRDGGIALLMVSDGGKARLKDLTGF
ncbi:MAG: GDYXXLXY domain-containing protein [bacterium]|nr:hypothetical protein [Gammaproteobacteria bacterium]HIL98118.1 hypothetical protein [Pseudomonadales bacterium]